MDGNAREQGRPGARRGRRGSDRGRGVRAVACVLVACLFGQGPAGVLLGRGLPEARAGDEAGPSPEGMSAAELAGAIEKHLREFDRFEARMWKDIRRLYADRNQQFTEVLTELRMRIGDLGEEIEAKQLAIDQVHADVKREGRKPLHQETERLKVLEVELSGLKGKVASLEGRFSKVSAEHLTFEMGAVPQVEALKAAMRGAGQLLVEKVGKLTEIGMRRFPQNPYFQTSAWRPQQVVRGGGKAAPADAGTLVPVEGTLNDVEFLAKLNEPLFAKQGLKLPTEFYRVGLPEYADLGELNGVKQLNLFKEWEDAKDYLGDRFRGADQRIYRIEAAELVKTATGRKALMQIAADLLGNRDLADFRVPIPDAEAYERAVLERVQPRPAIRPEPPAPAPERPPESKLDLVKPEASSPEGKLEGSLDLARRRQLTEAFPDLEGANQREALIRPEEADVKIAEIFEEQRLEALAEATANEVDADLKAQAAETLDKLGKVHTPEAGLACVEQGKATFNAQPEAVRARISRGRFLAELWKQGLEGMKEAKGPWHNRGINQLFLCIGLWDIGFTLVQDGLVPAAKKAGLLVGISLTLSWLAKQGAAEGAGRLAVAGLVLSEVVVLGFTIFGLIDLWDRFANRLPEYLAEQTYTAQILGTKPWTLVDPQGNPQAETSIGFLTHPESPAFGLPRATWFLKYRSDTELLQAIADYYAVLKRAFGGAALMPPHFDAARNHAQYTKTILGEWAAKHKELHDEVSARFEERRRKQLEQETNLTYPVSKSPRPVPAGQILAVKMIPEIPKRTDKEIRILTYQAVAGLPGDEVTAQPSVGMRRGDDAPVAASLPAKPLSFGVGQAYRLYSTESTFRLAGPGDYTVRIEQHLTPAGRDPEPRELKFSILGDEEPATPATVGLSLFTGNEGKVVQTSFSHAMFVRLKFDPPPEKDAAAIKAYWEERHRLGRQIDGKWLVIKAQCEGKTRYAYERMTYYPGSTSFELSSSTQVGGFPAGPGLHEIVATASVLGRTYTAVEKFDSQPFPAHVEGLKANLKAAPGYVAQAKKELAEKGPTAKPELRAIYEKGVLNAIYMHGTYVIQDGRYAEGIAMIEGVLPDLLPRMGDYDRNVLLGQLADRAAEFGDAQRLLTYRMQIPGFRLDYLAHQYLMLTGDLVRARQMYAEYQQKSGDKSPPRFPLTDGEILR